MVKEATAIAPDLEETEKKEAVSIYRPEMVLETMLGQFRKGKEKGTKTYISDIDEIGPDKIKAWSWRPGEFNIWTGYNGEGKTQFLVFLCLLKAINEGKKFAFFSPENFPPGEFFDDMIHTIIGKPTDREHTRFNMTEKEYLEAFEAIKDLFYFVYPRDKEGHPEFSIERIEEGFADLVIKENIYGVIVDPYIKIRHYPTPGEPEHLYASRFMMDRINFTRALNVSYNLVMHQVTPRKEQSGNYPRPNLYSIKGGGTFADSADNVLTVWRPFRGTDPKKTEVKFISEKIKKQKLVGMPTEVELNFDRFKNRYISPGGFDYFQGGEMLELSPSGKVEVYRPDQFKNDGFLDFDPGDKLPF